MRVVCEILGKERENLESFSSRHFPESLNLCSEGDLRGQVL
jgi:hypothetical protein